MTREASGFICPCCGHDVADVLAIRLPQLELQCRECRETFAVES
jgi:hypothetical protein